MKDVRFAAVDLGSNSFHMVIAVYDDGIEIVDRLKDMVRLKSGMDRSHRILPEVEQRSLRCLAEFRLLLDGLDDEHVLVVGTDALRKAENSLEFRRKAEATLGYPIEIISGLDEARLIYSGVDHFMDESPAGRRMVVDIGGGSTEIIIGDHEQVLDLHSVDLGCVDFTDRYFATGVLTERNLRDAVAAAANALTSFADMPHELGVGDVVGSSGTARAIERVVTLAGWSEVGITRQSLQILNDKLLEGREIARLSMPGLSDERRPVFPAGVAIMIGVFETLNIEFMHSSEYALREGVLLELIERYHARRGTGR